MKIFAIIDVVSCDELVKQTSELRKIYKNEISKNVGEIWKCQELGVVGPKMQEARSDGRSLKKKPT